MRAMLGILLATYVSVCVFNGTARAQSVPLPPPKPYALTAEHAERLITRLALRFGFDLFGPLNFTQADRREEQILQLLKDARPYAPFIPLWVTELPRQQFAKSLEGFTACQVLASQLPATRPEGTIGVSCGQFAQVGQRPGSQRLSLLFIEHAKDNIVHGRLWVNGKLGPLISAHAQPPQKVAVQ